MKVIDKTTCKIISAEALTACAEGLHGVEAQIEPHWTSALIVRADGKYGVVNCEIVTTIEKNSCVRIDYVKVKAGKLYVFPNGTLTIPRKALIAALANAPSIPLADFFGSRRGYNHRLQSNERELEIWLSEGEK